MRDFDNRLDLVWWALRIGLGSAVIRQRQRLPIIGSGRSR